MDGPVSQVFLPVEVGVPPNEGFVVKGLCARLPAAPSREESDCTLVYSWSEKRTSHKTGLEKYWIKVHFLSIFISISHSLHNILMK